MARIHDAALDGYTEFVDLAQRRQVIAEFAKVGGDANALYRALLRDPDCGALLREREAFWRHRAAAEHRGWLTARLAGQRKARRILAANEDPSEAAVRASEAQTVAVLRRVKRDAKANDPVVLATRRRANARGTDREHLHHQIGPVLKFGILHGDDHLVAIRRHFIPEIIRTVYSHVKATTPALEWAEGRKPWAAMFGDPVAVRQEIRRRVSIVQYRRTADLVRSFYPFLGWDVTARRVRTTIENATQKLRTRR